MSRARLAAAACMAVTGLAASSARAADDERPRVVVYSEGSRLAEMRDDAERTLEDSASIETRGSLERAWTSLGLSGRPRIENGGRLHREALMTGLRDAARLARLDAVVVLASPRKGHAAHVVLLAPAMEVPIVDARVEQDAGAGRARMRELLTAGLAYTAASRPARALEPADARPAPAAAPTASAPAPRDADAPGAAPGLALAPAPDGDVAAPRAPAPDGARWIDASAGVELGARDFRYNDRVSASLRSYSVLGAPLGAAAIDVAPFASSSDRRLSGLGIAAEGAASIGLSSEGAGAQVDSQWSRFAIGPRFRVRLQAAPAVDVGGSVSYGAESFTFAGASAASSAQLPAVAYRVLRPGLDVRVGLGRVTASARVGYDSVLSAGDVADRMQGTSVAGIDGALGGELALGAGFAVRAKASYRRFFYAFHPEPGAAYVAGGAVDQLVSLGAFLAWTR